MKIRKLLSTMALSAIVASNALATEPVKVEWGDPVKRPWGDPSDPEGANVCSWFQWGQDLWFDYNNDGYMDRFVIGGKHEDLGHICSEMKREANSQTYRSISPNWKLPERWS